VGIHARRMVDNAINPFDQADSIIPILEVKIIQGLAIAQSFGAN